MGGVTQWVARLTRNVEGVVVSNPTKDSRCFIEQETLTLVYLIISQSN